MNDKIERFRQTAEAHWRFIETTITFFGLKQRTIDLMHWLYVEAMVHGYKHALNDIGK